MSDVSAALGERMTFTWRGKEYTLVPWDQYGIQRQFETWLKRRAWDALIAARDSIPPEAYKEAAASLIQDVAAGVYAWESNVWAKSLATVEGCRRITWLVLQVTHKDLTEEDVGRLLDEMGKEVSQKMNVLVADPNGKSARARD